MSELTAAAFAALRRGVVVAPAGCGKTELIARAVASDTSQRQLVLTHTHAGVRALRDRFQRLGVPMGAATIETIASWSLRYAFAYPALGGLDIAEPSGEQWERVYAAAHKIFESGKVLDVVRATYAGAFVDEYQDCNESQHALLARIADAVPCRLVGDPLQGIFGFRKNRLVRWGVVESVFPKFGELSTPWRWRGKNEALGRWLFDVRAPLLEGRDVDLCAGPLAWAASSPETQAAAAWRLTREQGSVVVIHKWPDDCHDFASRLRGSYESMEEMDSNALMKHADEIFATNGTARAKAVVDFALACASGLASQLTTIRQNLERGRHPEKTRLQKNVDIVEHLERVAGAAELAAVAPALTAMTRLDGVNVYRRELLAEMRRALDAYAAGGHATLRAAAWYVRNMRRHIGRRIEKRTVSRTLLIKGLEFDHAAVLDAGALEEQQRPGNGAKNLYVAMTRPCRSLTVLSAEPTIRLAPAAI